MKSLRPFFEWWNETGLFASIALATGAFASRGSAGYVTTFITLILGIAAIALAYIVAHSQESTDESFSLDDNSDIFPRRFLPYAVLFCGGLVAAIGIGRLI